MATGVMAPDQILSSSSKQRVGVVPSVRGTSLSVLALAPRLCCPLGWLARLSSLKLLLRAPVAHHWSRSTCSHPVEALPLWCMLHPAPASNSNTPSKQQQHPQPWLTERVTVTAPAPACGAR